MNIKGFLGSVNYATYIHVDKGVRIVEHKNPEFAGVCRNMLTDIADSELADEFDIQKLLSDVVTHENKSNSAVY